MADGQPEAGQGEGTRGGQPGVLAQVIDRDAVRLLAECAGLAGSARVLGERAGILADGDVVEGGGAAELVGVDDEIVRGHRRLPRAGPQLYRDPAHRDGLAEVGDLRVPDGREGDGVVRAT